MTADERERIFVRRCVCVATLFAFAAMVMSTVIFFRHGAACTTTMAHPDTLKVRELLVVDDRGHTRISLRAEDDDATVAMTGADGSELVRLRAADHDVVLQLGAAGGGAVLLQGRGDRSLLALLGKNEHVGVSLAAGDGVGSLLLQGPRKATFSVAETMGDLRAALSDVFGEPLWGVPQ